MPPTNIAFIGSYLPRRCGIATFTKDLATAVAEAVGGPDLGEGGPINIVAMTDGDEEYRYGPEVTVEIQQQRLDSYRDAADVINNSKVEVLCLQHEYGLFGGKDGSHLLELLSRVRKPVVTTLHTILSEPTDSQRDVLRRICDRSSQVIVMADRAKSILTSTFGVDADRIRLIPHGVPDVPFGDTAPFKNRFHLSGRPVILTFGLLSPSKGIELMLDALAKIVPNHPDVAYIVLGVTHPGVQRESGELYRLSLENQAVDLGIQKNVLFHNQFVSLDDLREYLQAADLYVTPYGAKEQITSGTLAYALASGRAIVSTPYWYAQELLANGRGRLVEFGDSDALAANLDELLGDADKRETMRKAAYDFGRQMVWSRVGDAYVEAFDGAVADFADRAPSLIGPPKAQMRMSLPSCRMDHLYRMTDDTGILQHSVYMTPDRHHGYCTDDNARALIVTAMAWSLFQDHRALLRLHVYLSFLHFAHDAQTGRFRNFMSYDRRWLENDGSDDCQGRALWALGYLISHAPSESDAALAKDVFRNAMTQVHALHWPRSWALSILGLHYYLREVPDDDTAREKMNDLATRLNNRFLEHESDDWPWFEDEVTYDNGRIPQALIIAGLGLDRKDLVDRGLRVLRWLLDVQTSQDGHLSIVGNDGWFTRNGTRAAYDQQALEPAALIGACKAAFRASNDSNWLIEMRRCFKWYLGQNDGNLSMIDFKSRGCYDGLTSDGVNTNQGAESVLSWLLSNLIMHEMQTGDAPGVG